MLISEGEPLTVSPPRLIIPLSSLPLTARREEDWEAGREEEEKGKDTEVEEKREEVN